MSHFHTLTRRLPAEWEPQSAVLLTFPHEQSDWAPILKIVEPIFIEIASRIAAHQTVWVNCQSITHEKQLKSKFVAAQIPLSAVRFFHMKTEDTWARDHGPITVWENGVLKTLDFQFNGWGGKYVAKLDNQINTQLHQQGAFGNGSYEATDFILEGGSIETDGKGTLLTTTSCLLNPNRNAQLTPAQIEQALKKQLGVQRILWLTSGYLAGDDTDSHIDMLARFTDPSTIAYVQCNDPADEHFSALQKMEQELQSFLTPEQQPYRLVPLPFPPAQFKTSGERLPLSYANFLIINQAVLVPIYGLASDQLALKALQSCFPDRTLVPIRSDVIIQQSGSLHCLTMQIPAER